MKIAVIGTGYVGLVTGACFAELGHTVTCMDQDQSKVAHLQAGGVPIYESGLEPLVAQNAALGRLRFTAEMAVALDGAELLFLAVGTPEGADGSVDLSQILAAAAEIGRKMTGPLVVVQKSTCPVGTARQVEERVWAALAERGVAHRVAVVSNPEFLREGSAVRDFMAPDRVVIGAEDEAAGRQVASLYQPIVSEERILLMDRATAELTKYAANAFLATKISFINEMANLCELVGADVEGLRRGIGSDPRIGPAFLSAGVGYGGSCLPKDVKALIKSAALHGYSLRILAAADAINREQRERQVVKIAHCLGGSLLGRRIAIWGLAFKPGTDDMREAPAIGLTRRLLEMGADLVAHDPVAMAQAARVLDQRVRLAPDPMACLDGADALLLLTEWPEFQRLDLEQAGARMNRRILFDLRNAMDPSEAIQRGFTYFGVGRGFQAAMGAAAESSGG